MLTTDQRTEAIELARVARGLHQSTALAASRRLIREILPVHTHDGWRVALPDGGATGDATAAVSAWAAAEVDHADGE